MWSKRKRKAAFEAGEKSMSRGETEVGANGGLLVL